MNLIFDLDGTLVDAKPRVYDLYKSLVPETRLDFSAYWSYKSKGFSNVDLLEMVEMAHTADKERFLSQWMRLIEAPALLKRDRVIAGVEENLRQLSLGFQLTLCTNRQDRSAVDQQLLELGLKPFFSTILVTEQKVQKNELLLSAMQLDPWDWMIGDTGQDISDGTELGLRTCAVLTGFHGREALERYRPSRILESASEFHPDKLRRST